MARRIDVARIAKITGINIQSLNEPQIGDVWATWEQLGSRGLMDSRVAALKKAGVPAFFNAGERRWGVKIADVLLPTEG